MSNGNQPNVGEDFIRFHKIITRGLDVALQNVDSFLNKGIFEKSKEGFLKFLQTFSSFVEGHHLVENEKVFPYFMNKIPEVPYDRLMDEHKEIKSALKKINQGITELKSGKDDLKPLKLLKSGLVQIDVIWHPHIQIEESLLYERVESLQIDSEEMARLRKEVTEFFQEHTGPPYLVAPFALYNLSPEDRAILASGFPEAVTKKLIPIDWKDEWTPMKPYLLK